MRIGVVNRYTPEKRRMYPLGLALDQAGARYVPIDVRDLRVRVDSGLPELGLLPPFEGGATTSLRDLALDGIVWRVSEAEFGLYSNIVDALSRRYPLINQFECISTCSDKWRTMQELSSAGIRVVPTALLLPGDRVPGFDTARTVIKPSVGAGGRGVTIAGPGTCPDIAEAYVAQPFVSAPAEDHVRVLVCGTEPVAAMHRHPSDHREPAALTVNNIGAGGYPVRADLGPVSELSARVAQLLGGDLLGIDLVPWEGQYAVLEVNSSPGLTGISQVSVVDCYRSAARSVIDRLQSPWRVGHSA